MVLKLVNLVPALAVDLFLVAPMGKIATMTRPTGLLIEFSFHAASLDQLALPE